MKIYLLAFLLFVTGIAMGQSTYPYPEPKPTTGNTPNTVTRMSIPVAPSAYNNASPIVWDTDIGGGLQSRLNATDRLAVRWARPGALVFDQSNGIYYAMEGTPLQATRQLFGIDGTWFGPLSQDKSIYNSNGTFTDHRVIGGNGFNILWRDFDVMWQIANTLHLRGNNAVLFETPRVRLLQAQVGEVLRLDNVNGTGEFHPAPNLYNENGSLSGERNVLFNGHSLTFDAGANTFLIHGQPGSSTIFVTPTTTIEAATAFNLRTPEVVSGGVGPKVGQVLTLQSDGKAEFKPGASGNTLYTGDGTIASERIVHFGTTPGSGANLNFDLNGNEFHVIGGSTSFINLEAPNVQLETSGGLFLKTPEVLSAGVPAKTGQVLTLQSDGKAEFKPGGAAGSAINSGVATLAGGLYTVASPTPPFTAGTYPDFLTVEVRVPGVNAGGESLKWGSGPAKQIKMNSGVALPAGEMTSTVNYLLSYSTSADAWILKNPAGTFITDSTLTMTTPPGSTVSTLAVNPAAITPANNTVTAAKLSFVNPLSIMASQGSAGAGTEIKLGPFWTIRNGMLERNVKNIMFEFNSWWVTSNLQDVNNWQSGGGTGSTTGIGGTAGHAGIAVMQTATTAASFHSVGWRTDLCEFTAGNKLYFFTRLRVPTLSVGGGEAFKIFVGFGDTSSVALRDQDCIFVTYTDTTNATSDNGGRWNLDVGAATVHSDTDSGVTVSAVAGKWYDIEVECTTTAINWSVDGDPKPAYTGANIPVGDGKEFTPMIKIVGITGSTQRSFQIDAFNGWGVYSF